MKLAGAQRDILLAMAEGCCLKAHRDLNGHKVYQLHPLQGAPIPVPPAIIARLCDEGLIDSNKKFPVATFWLTAKACDLLAVEPVGVHSTNVAAG